MLFFRSFRGFAVGLLFFMAFAPFEASAQSGRIQGDYVGCVTRQALDEFITAATRDDHRQMGALLGSVCVNMNGLPYSIVRRGFVRSEVRVYASGSSIVLFTVSEAVR